MDTSSRHKIGDKVILNFFDSGTVGICNVAAVKYTDYGKVLYDVSLIPFQNEEHIVILKDIDSYYVQTEAEKILG